MNITTENLPILQAVLTQEAGQFDALAVQLNGTDGSSLTIPREHVGTALRIVDELIAACEAEDSFQVWEWGIDEGWLYALAVDRGQGPKLGGEATSGIRVHLETGYGQRALHGGMSRGNPVAN